MIHKCPRRLTDEDSIRFINRLWKHVHDPELIIDFSGLNFVFPFATLLLAESLRELVLHRSEVGLQTLSNDESDFLKKDGAISYLKHVGFFKFVGIPYGKEPNEALGNRNYIPIRILNQEELCRRASRGVIQEAIVKESEEVAGLILDNPEECVMLTYCFREIIRNVFEHAEIDYCSLMGQKWNRGRYAAIVEIAIVDRGRGILDSLREAYDDLTSAEQAIRKALEPGASRIHRPQSRDDWDNTGYGLYVLSRLGMSYGEFAICSSGVILTTSRMEEARNVHFQGTAVKLRVNTQHAEYFPNALKKIVEEGEAQYYEQTGKRKNASKSSKHLS